MKFFQTIIITLCLLAFSACGTTESAESPTASLKKFNEASKSKDIETTKKLLSKSTLDIFQKTADAQKTTVDKILLNDNAASLKELPEIRNEKIEGDTATVEVKNKATGDFDPIPFVKEDGVWKIALDKFMQNMLKKQPPRVTTSSANNSQSSEPAANSNNK